MMPCFFVTIQRRVRDLKASVSRCKRKRTSQSKTIHADLYYTCHCSDLLLYVVIPVTIFSHL